MEHVASFPYRLASHVYACRRAGHVVLLDLRRDQYIGLNETDQARLRPWVDDWPPGEGESARSDQRAFELGREPDESTRKLLEEMRSVGMIVRDSYEPRFRTPPHCEPARSLIEGYDEPSCDIRAADVVRMMAAGAVARALLRWRSLEFVTRRFHRRHFNHLHAPFDIEHARVRMAIFNRLRPLFFTESDQCLFHSLAAAEFLAQQGLFPNWVFGIRTDPFAAHCWLQNEEVVINDTPEIVGVFTPILVL